VYDYQIMCFALLFDYSLVFIYGSPLHNLKIPTFKISIAQTVSRI